MLRYPHLPAGIIGNSSQIIGFRGADGFRLLHTVDDGQCPPQIHCREQLVILLPRGFYLPTIRWFAAIRAAQYQGQHGKEFKGYFRLKAYWWAGVL